jgi:hypothetical protein
MALNREEKERIEREEKRAFLVNPDRGLWI